MAVAWVCVVCFIGFSRSESSLEHEYSANGSNDTYNGNLTDNNTDHHTVHRYEVAHVDFARVMTPYVISAWIILASLAKIREYHFP